MPSELFFILGRSPALSLAEIRVVVSPDAMPLSPTAAIAPAHGTNDSDDARAYGALLGGIIKAGRIMRRVHAHTPEELRAHLVAAATETATAVRAVRTGKITMGLSMYPAAQQAHATALNARTCARLAQRAAHDAKHALTATGLSIRFVMPAQNECALSAVQVEKNRLVEKTAPINPEGVPAGPTGVPVGPPKAPQRVPSLSTPRGAELVCMQQGEHPDTWVIGITDVVQPFESFSHRDFGRPRRNAKSGMLPPKLARIMVNLAAPPLSTPRGALLDPFCGSGTVLMEAALAGYGPVYGADIDERAVRDAGHNLSWAGITTATVRAGDARAAHVMFKDITFNAVVTEPFLGAPLTGRERPADIQTTVRALADLYILSLASIKKILAPGGTVVMAVPCFLIKNAGPKNSGPLSHTSAPHTWVSVLTTNALRAAGWEPLTIVDVKSAKMLHPVKEGDGMAHGSAYEHNPFFLDKNALVWWRTDQHLARQIYVMRVK